MTPARLQDWNTRLLHWAFARHPNEFPPLAWLRAALRIVSIVILEARHNAISLRAAALTYTVVLSMVPLLALTTSLLKAFGGDNQLRTAAHRFIDQLERKAEPPPIGEPPAQPAVEVEKIPQPGDPQSLPNHLRDATNAIFHYVDNTNFAAIGIFGILGLLITVILLLDSIEAAMNTIWHTGQGRSLLRKIMDYLALLILLPISINLAIAGDTILQSQDLLVRLQQLMPWEWLVHFLLRLLPFLLVVLSLMVMYLFFPAVRVSTPAALCGALLAATLWFLVQRLYIDLQLGVARSNAIYGTFATVPLFLVWVHLTWSFILFGACLAFAIQHRNRYRPSQMEDSPQRVLQRALQVMQAIYADFNNLRKTTREQLALALPGHHEERLLKTLDLLLQGGLIAQIEEQGTPRIIPVMPVDRFQPAALVRLFFGDEQLDSPAGTMASKAVRAAYEAIPDDFFLASQQDPPPNSTP